MRIRIGDLLVKAGVITDLQLKAALAGAIAWGGKLGDILVRMEFITEEVLVRALSKQTGIARARPSPARRPDRREARPPRTAGRVQPGAPRAQGRGPHAGGRDERPRQRDGHRPPALADRLPHRGAAGRRLRHPRRRSRAGTAARSWAATTPR